MSDITGFWIILGAWLIFYSIFVLVQYQKHKSHGKDRP